MSFLQRYHRQLDPLRSERRVELVVLVLLALLVLQLVWGAYRSVFPSVPRRYSRLRRRWKYRACAPLPDNA